MAKKSRFQKFATKTIPRTRLKGAPYNPRVIDEKARARLKKGLEEKGLVEPIVWNEQTGNIVGGHQRIEQLDALEGSKDYTLTVAVINVPEKEEKELNVLLNNPSAQGDWDIEKLKEIFEDDDVDIEGTGFDMAEVYQLFGNEPTAAPAKVLGELNKQLEEAKETISKMDSDHADTDDDDFFLVVVFPSHKERKKFTDSAELDDNRYVDGRWLDEYVFGEPESEPEPEKEEAKK
jgi:ParB-like chromosome segregation protein Spo0J